MTIRFNKLGARRIFARLMLAALIASAAAIGTSGAQDNRRASGNKSQGTGTIAKETKPAPPRPKEPQINSGGVNPLVISRDRAMGNN